MKAITRERFNIVEFTNESGSISHRVIGYKRNGERIRENFESLKAALVRQLELRNEDLAGHAPPTEIQATTLTPARLRLAEAAFARLNVDEDLLPAVESWLKEGKAKSVQTTARLDEAFTAFSAWLDGSKQDELIKPPPSPLSRKNLRIRVQAFINSVPNHQLSDITTEFVEAYLATRTNLSGKSKDNERRALSRFFNWCKARPRRWLAINPCQGIEIDKGENGEPAIMTVDECKKLVRAAEKLKGGALVPYVALALFAGLRPFELTRVTWDIINLVDGEIRLEATKTKTKKPRTITICKTLRAWLERYKDRELFPRNWRRDFDRLKAAAGYGGREWKTEAKTEKGKKRAAKRKKAEVKSWVPDLMRHTSVSHYFRKTGSYGETAERFGNSEAIVKLHYQGRVTSQQTAEFYALRPSKGGAK